MATNGVMINDLSTSQKLDESDYDMWKRKI